MHASLTTVRGGGPDVSATAGMAAESMLAWLREFDGYRGLLVLGDPEGGNARIMSFWDTLESLERSERSETGGPGEHGRRRRGRARKRRAVRALHRRRADRADPRAGDGGRRAVHDLRGPSGEHRGGTANLPRDLVDWFRDATGFRGWLALLDAPGGRSIGITLWAAKEASPTRSRAAQASNEIAASLETAVASVERYEVVMLDILDGHETR